MGSASLVGKSRIGRHISATLSQFSNSELAIIATNQSTINPKNMLKILQVEVLRSVWGKSLPFFLHSNYNDPSILAHFAIPEHYHENKNPFKFVNKYDLSSQKTFNNDFFSEKFRQVFAQILTEIRFRPDITETSFGRNYLNLVENYNDSLIKDIGLESFINRININKEEKKLLQCYIITKFISPTTQVLLISNPEELLNMTKVGGT